KNSAHIEQSYLDLSFCLPNISYNNVHNKINHRKAYVTVNGLSKKAIQTGLDTGDDEVASSNSSSDEGSIAIENPIVYSRKVSNTRHNKAGCEVWHKQQ
ncbi:9870_t:CDS:2, partial [Racocetra persica]